MIGHAWPLTQGDAKNSRPKTNCTNTYTLPTGVQRARALCGIVELTRPPSGGSRGQLRLSLTNTYHEWPVFNDKAGSISATAGTAPVLRRRPSMAKACDPRAPTQLPNRVIQAPRR